MQFTRENAEKVMAGTKTQTRRPVKNGEKFYSSFLGLPAKVIDANGRIKWQEGRTYSVQPGRGKSGIGKIRLIHIERERLQDITGGDCIAEGIAATPGKSLWHEDIQLKLAYFRLWDSIYPNGQRVGDNPLVNALTFEKVEE